MRICCVRDSDSVIEAACDTVAEFDCVSGSLIESLVVAAIVLLGEKVCDGVGGGVMVSVMVSVPEGVRDSESLEVGILESELVGSGESEWVFEPETCCDGVKDGEIEAERPRNVSDAETLAECDCEPTRLRVCVNELDMTTESESVCTDDTVVE